MNAEFLNAFAAQCMDQRGIARERLTFTMLWQDPLSSGILVKLGAGPEVQQLTLYSWMATDEQCALVSKALEALFPQPKRYPRASRTDSVTTSTRPSRFAARRAPLGCRHWTGAT